MCVVCVLGGGGLLKGTFEILDWWSREISESVKGVPWKALCKFKLKVKLNLGHTSLAAK